MSYDDVQRINVPGGWIYYGGPLGSPVLVVTQSNGATPTNRQFSWPSAIFRRSYETGTTISGQLDADTTELQGDLATLTTDIASLQAQLSAALATVTPGSTITEAQVDALTAVHTGFAALAAGGYKSDETKKVETQSSFTDADRKERDERPAD
jgi:hypothetical protein